MKISKKLKEQIVKLRPKTGDILVCDSTYITQGGIELIGHYLKKLGILVVLVAVKGDTGAVKLIKTSKLKHEKNIPN